MCPPALAQLFPFSIFQAGTIIPFWKVYENGYGKSGKALRNEDKGSAFLPVVGKDQWLAISRGYHIVIDLTTTKLYRSSVSCFCCHAAQFSALGKLCQEDEGSLYYPRSRGEKALRLSAAFTFWAGHIPRYVGQHYS